MSDEEDDRLLIDDVPDTSTESFSANSVTDVPSSQENLPTENKCKLAIPVNGPFFVEQNAVAIPFGQANVNVSHEFVDRGDSSASVVDTDVLKEEGELDEDDMEMEITFGETPNESTIPSTSSKSVNIPSYCDSVPSHNEESVSVQIQMPVLQTNGIKPSFGPSAVSVGLQLGASTDKKRPLSPPHKSSAETSLVKKFKPKSLTDGAKRDVSTCVHSQAVQSDGDDSPFEMTPGSSFVLQMTVVCRIEGTNTMYVSAKWKDKELSGILTDGEPPAFNAYAKKRAQLAGATVSSSNGSTDSSEKLSSHATPSKKRIGRGGSSQTDPRRKNQTRANNAVDVEEGDDDEVGGESRPTSGGSGSIALSEVPERKFMHVCSFNGCEHRYSSGAELEYHKSTNHQSRAVMYESICSQTDISSLNRVSVHTDTDGLNDNGLTEKQIISIDQLIKAGAPLVSCDKKAVGDDAKSPSAFSDISDDGAPQLQKEEPQPLTVADAHMQDIQSGSGDLDPAPASISVPTLPNLDATTKSAVSELSKSEPIPSAALPSPHLQSFQPVASSSTASPIPIVNVSVSSGIDSQSNVVNAVVASAGALSQIHASPRATNIQMAGTSSTATVGSGGGVCSARGGSAFLPTLNFPPPQPFMAQFVSPMAAATGNRNGAVPSPGGQLRGDHKIHQLKTNEGTAASDAVSIPSNLAKPPSSPAQPRPFNMPGMGQPGGPGSSPMQVAAAQAAHQQQQMQMHMMQQMMMQQMMGAGQRFPVSSASAQQAASHEHILAMQMAAMQSQYGVYGGPK